VTPRLARLRAELDADLGAFDARVGELAALRPLTSELRSELAVAAVALHHAYGAVESALVRLARAFGDEVPGGPEWHQQLLHAATLDVEGVRPPVLSPEAANGLRKLLSFRHFFRHAYAVEFDASELESLRRLAVTLQPRVRADFSRFDEVLRELGGTTR